MRSQDGAYRHPNRHLLPRLPDREVEKQVIHTNPVEEYDETRDPTLDGIKYVDGEGNLRKPSKYPKTFRKMFSDWWHQR